MSAGRIRTAFAGLLALPVMAQQAIHFYSADKEQALGKQIAAEVRRQSKPLDQPAVAAYVKKIGSRLVSKLPQTSLTYDLEVINTDATEPIALPGGYILIPASFFLAVNNEDEFASMLAHSIGHVVMRHGLRGTSRGAVDNAASIPLIFMGGWMGSHADSQHRILVPAAFSPVQRTYELQADQFGVALASGAGFNASGLRDYVQRSQKADANPAISPLPARELRIANIEKMLSPASETPRSSGEFLLAQKAIRDALKQPEPSHVPTLRRGAELLRE